MENILKIFISQDVSEIKQSLKEIIIEQFRSDFEENSSYLFSPDDVREIMMETFNEVLNEVKQEYKSKLREKISSLTDKEIEKIVKGKK